ncbi:Phytochrome, two-component sensor histidine kinase [Arcticibacter svalbardensis MN12-7]|uniref:histidine kinase n=1 Tax=Arcticibacter svalbardensis MN12-7 TaxID=1150600 RepID=R9GNW5_9SPHI|nr:ATP-binding protein [Arcticibacter svalbardensis]EOR93418.1 Phytochrome, two-component sensor histidine kinase [Arcticibacter svalbardensis MN12-7]
MNAYNVNLTNCDIEPIHILGQIQSHGFLVAVNSETHIITYISENIHVYIRDEGKNYLGKSLSELEEKLNLDTLESELTISQLITVRNYANGLEAINPFLLKLNSQPYFMIVTSSGDNKILEFEPAAADVNIDVQQTIGRSISEILSVKKLDAMLQKAATEIKRIIGYGRIMVYKFGEDGHGEVVAEAKEDFLAPFMGLHYPASDIPKQARELYKINLTRIIADVNSINSAIITDKLKNIPLDLTHSCLRAVSPIHIQYLKNMGVESSFSISLLAHGELWGLIACHNYSPKFINYKARDAAKLLGQILSSALEYRQGEEDSEKFTYLNQGVNQLIEHLEKETNINEALFRDNISIKDINSATGAVLVFENKITRIGDTPNEEQIEEIVEWLKINMSDSVYYTHRFPQIFSASKIYSQIGSGILACMLSRELGEFIIWFKPEQIQTLTWAGNPEKPVEQSENGLLTLSPRKSFDGWTDIVKNTSEKWNRAEIAAVVNLREHVIYVITRKANEIRLLNEKLKHAYEELDTFSFTVSHDLRTPLSSIKTYSELLITNNKSLDDNARKVLDRIKVCADRMDLLIKEILKYSMIGKADVQTAPIDMTHLINEIKEDVIVGLQPKDLEFHIGDTPDIQGDPVMINQVFTNLINNAVKYSAKSTPSVVNINGVKLDKETIYTISDNGVGIDDRYYKLVFELFKRMDNVKDFEGTGVGLAIVKRIIEKHHARVWFESKLGMGTTFYLSFVNS